MRGEPAGRTGDSAGFAVVGVILALVLAAGAAVGFVQVHGSMQNRPDQSIRSQDPTRPAAPAMQPENLGKPTAP